MEWVLLIRLIRKQCDLKANGSLLSRAGNTITVSGDNPNNYNCNALDDGNLSSETNADSDPNTIEYVLAENILSNQETTIQNLFAKVLLWLFTLRIIAKLNIN